MSLKVFAIDTQAGIQRDGTVFDKNFYTSGRWVRFQRGRPRKIGGFKEISAVFNGPSRGIWVNPVNDYTVVYSGYSSGLQSVTLDANGVGSSPTNYTLSGFTASDNNLWQFDGFYDSFSGGIANILAHPGQDLNAIAATVNTRVLIGSTSGTTLSPIGVFTIAATLASSTNVTVASTTQIGAGQSVTGTGIPSGTTVVSVTNATVFVISAAATLTGSSTLTIDNGISVSGGVVSLHPYVFVYGNNGLIKNCAAGNPNDWVSADANETNVATGKIVQGFAVRGGSNAPSGLFWATDSLIRVSYIGGQGTPAQYWRYDIISNSTTIISSQSVVEYDGVYFWIGVDRFLLYNGVVKELKNEFNQNYFFDNLNYAQRQKVWGTKVTRFGEVWWFFPSGNSTECNDAIIYNIREDVWYDAGTSIGSQRSAGYFSQVFHYPICAGWETTVQTTVFSVSSAVSSGSTKLYYSVVNVDAQIGQLISGTGIPANTTVSALTTNGLRTLGAITGGSGYTNGAYSGVALTGGSGFGATANITVSGGAVTVVALVNRGAGYTLVNTLSAAAASIGGTGAGFSVAISALWAQTITMSAAATSTGTYDLAFGEVPGLISLWQHEYGTNIIKGQSETAIESYFETSDLGIVAGGPAQPSMIGDNVWLHIDRVEPDFVQSGDMEMYITGRPFAQADDVTSGPYVFSPTTGKIDVREQRREIRFRFRSNVLNGDYQLGRMLLNADVGDVRPYGS
jgi:hypothetical protein